MKYFLFSIIGIILCSCLLVSKQEISSRILDAMPFETKITLIALDTSISCIATSFSYLGEINSFVNQDITISKRLGKEWSEANSFYEYVETISDKNRKNLIEGTALFSKECLKEIGIHIDFFYNDRILISESKSGKEIILIFKNKANRGLYLAQGR